MQHSPQEIKSRLDRAVDPEGNVLDMAAVLDLVTTLERLPITREALETTRIGKTINLLRKKTNNDDLAKRAKKLVKKWQKLVINQIEASRSVDSPINGSRIASPQINGAIRETDKSSTPSLTDRRVKPKGYDSSKKNLKRKHSNSSSDNSPLMFVPTSSQDGIGSTVHSNITSNSLSTISRSTNSNEVPQSQKDLPSPESKKPRLMKDKLLDEDTNTTQLTLESSTLKDTTSNCLENKSATTKINNPDVNIVKSDPQQDFGSDQCDSNNGKCNVNNSEQNRSNFSNVNDNICENNSQGSVNTGSDKDQNQSRDEHRGDKSDVLHTMTLEKNNETNENSPTPIPDESANHVDDVKNSLEDSKCTVPEAKPSVKECSSPEQVQQKDKDCLDEKNMDVTCEETPSATLDESDQESGKDSLEPKELVLDMSEQANGVNGRYNDTGSWYSWTEVMPCKDGALNILPYVILD